MILKKKGKSHDYPILLLWGDNDSTVSYECSSYYKVCIPQAVLITFHGVGHMILIECISFFISRQKHYTVYLLTFIFDIIDPDYVTNILEAHWIGKKINERIIHKNIKNSSQKLQIEQITIS